MEQITTFKKEFLEEVKTVNASVNSLRDKISSSHNAEMGKSCLKSKLDSYLKLIPVINEDKLEKLFDRDEESCKANV